MRFTSTKDASNRTGTEFFCLTQPCQSNQLSWEYKGIVLADTQYLVKKDSCDRCGKGKLNTIPISHENSFEFCVNVLLNTHHSSTASLIALFNKVAADFDHSHESPSSIKTTSQHTFASRTAYLWIDNFITDREFELDSVVALYEQEQGVFSEYRNWWTGFVPAYLWGEGTKNAIEHYYSVLENRHEEYLNYGNYNHLVIDIEPSVEKLKNLNERMYFEIGSAFSDIQLAIDSELEWLGKDEVSSISIFDIHYALAVLNQYKNATIDAKSKFKLARSPVALTM